MTRFNTFQIVAVVVTLITGCASSHWQMDKNKPVTPQSYSVYRSPMERSVGKLRKVLLVNITLPNPEACAGSGDRPNRSPRWANRNYLHNVKGYDVSDAHERGNSLPEPSKTALVQLTAVAEKVGNDEAVSAPAAVGQLLFSDHKFDALMLVESSWTCLNAVPEYRWSIAAMSLGITELVPERQYLKTHRYYRATLFEAVTGRPVWQSSIRNRYNPNGSDSDEQKLFHDLEQAVPALLTQ